MLRMLLKSRYVLYIVLMLLILLALTPSLLFLIAKKNTLENNGSWIVTKRTFDVELIGANSYYLDTQALAHSRLNLGEWHGYQEVLYREAVIPESIRFSFFLSENSYIVIVFNRGDESFYGFRLSAEQRFPGAALLVKDDGQFIEKRVFQSPFIESGVWHEGKVDIVDSQAILSVDKVVVGKVPVLLADPHHVGFRGSVRHSAVDNVQIISHSGKEVFSEDFSNYEKVTLYIPVCWVCLSLLLVLCLVYVERKRSKDWGNVYAALVSTTFCISVVSTIVLFNFLHQGAGAYPVKDEKLLRREKGRREIHREKKYNLLRSQYAEKAAAGTYRIGFIGTSQTHGAGATCYEDAFVKRVENKLNELLKSEPRIECMNFAINGDTAATQFHYYKDTWSKYQPTLTVINLGNNDSAYGTPPEEFQEALSQFVALNMELGIKTLFVLEAVTLPKEEYLPTHQIIRDAASKYSIPVVDAHEYLQYNDDTGFLWWDCVHPTSYGHSLIADVLCDKLVEYIDERK